MYQFPIGKGKRKKPKDIDYSYNGYQFPIGKGKIL